MRKRKAYSLFTFFALMLLIVAVDSKAAAIDNKTDPVILRKGVEEYDLTTQLMILQDIKKEFTVESIFHPEIADKFMLYKDSKLSGQISNSSYWAKVVVQNDEDEAVNMFLELSKPHLNNVKFYRFEKEQLVEEVQTGTDYPFFKREIKNRNYVFNLNLPPKASQTLVFRVEAKSYLQLPVKLYTEQYFIEKEEHSNIVLGIYYGIMLIMLLYNLILYFSLKDKTYLYYCCFIFAFTIMQLIWDGLAFQYLWPKLILWNIKSNPFFIILAAIFSLQFTRSFLRVGERSRKFDRAMCCMLMLEISALITVILLPVAAATKIALFLITASSIICFASTKLAGERDRAVTLYIISWIALFIGSFLNILAAYKVLPLNFITLYSPRIGAVVNIVLLSLSLGERFNKMRQEKIIEEKQRVLLESLHGITKTITSTRNIDTMAAFLLQSMCRITKFPNGMIVLKEARGYEVKAVLGYKAQELKNRILFNLERDNYFNKIVEENNPVILTDVEMRGYGMDKCFRSFIGFPIAYHERNIGVIVLYSDTNEVSNSIQNEVLYDFTGQVGIAIENARLFNQVEKMAITDGLTGAFNRTHFLKLSEGSLEELGYADKCLSLLMLDIDNFKKINDTYGHIVGDKVLQQLITTLKEELDEDSIIGRYGGEEFLVLLKETDLKTAIAIAERLRVKAECLNINTKDSYIKFTISIGVVNTCEHNFSASQLIEKADEALYISKQRGRNQVNAIQIAV